MMRVGSVWSITDPSSGGGGGSSRRQTSGVWYRTFSEIVLVFLRGLF